MRMVIAAFLLFLMPTAANAYVGPGLGLGTIIVSLAIVLALVLLVVGFLWYPLKRLIRSKKAPADAHGTAETGD